MASGAADAIALRSGRGPTNASTACLMSASPMQLRVRALALSSGAHGSTVRSNLVAERALTAMDFGLISLPSRLLRLF